MGKLVIIPEETKSIIIEKWKAKKLNSINEISSEFDVKPAKVKAVINEFLSKSIKS